MTERNALELNKIHLGDCLEGMMKLENDSIDLTITSPPYDNLRTYNGYSFDFEGIAKELFRVTKEGGVVVWIVGDATIKGSETGTSFKQALFFKEIGFNLHDTMIYRKNNPMPQVKTKRYAQSFEYMFVLTKGAPNVCNYLLDDCKLAGTKNSTKNRLKDGSVIRGVSYGKEVQKTKIRQNVWDFTVGYGSVTKDKEAYKHPAIFPEKLVEDHITSWSNPNDTVLDPFMGSGTTAKMALLNDRKFIGFEISKEYIEIANERIRNNQSKSNV